MFTTNDQPVTLNTPRIVYVVLYIYVDNPELSDVLGVFTDKNDAVRELLERANYRENRQGQLTQYMIPTGEYPSYEYLRRKVADQMTLVDVDIYRIVEHRVTEHRM